MRIRSHLGRSSNAESSTKCQRPRMNVKWKSTKILIVTGKSGSSLKVLLLLIIDLIFIQFTSSTRGVHKCYSCMSRYYGHTWQFAGYSRIYMKPHAFTDDCQNPSANNAEVPYVYCEDFSNCIAMMEDIQIGVGARGYIRGCWSSLFLWGFNRTGRVGALRHHDFCGRFNSTQLPSSKTTVGRTFESQMNVCACAGNLCNSKPFISASLRTQPHSAKSLLWSLLFIAIFTYRCQQFKM